MVSKKKEILNPYNSAGVSFIVFLNVCQDRNFNKGLLDELLGFFHHFYRQKLFCFVVKNFQYLSKRTSINWWYDFVSVSDMWSDRVLIELGCVFRILEWFFLVLNVLGFKVMMLFWLVERLILLILNAPSGVLPCAVNCVFSLELKIPP